MAVRDGGRAAVTHWEVIERYRGAMAQPVREHHRCRLETGPQASDRGNITAIGISDLGDARLWQRLQRPRLASSPDDAETARGPWQTGLCMPISSYRTSVAGHGIWSFRSERKDDLLRLRNSLVRRAQRLMKALANQGSRVHGGVTATWDASSHFFENRCPVELAAAIRPSRSQQDRHRRSGSGGCASLGGAPGADFWRAIIWPYRGFAAFGRQKYGLTRISRRSAVPNAANSGRINAGQALREAWRPHAAAKSSSKAFAPPSPRSPWYRGYG